MSSGIALADTAMRSIDEAVRVVAEAAHGVEAAHRVGILHRDLKPANIPPLPVSRGALLMDFGLAAPQLYPIATADTPPTQTCTVANDDDERARSAIRFSFGLDATVDDARRAVERMRITLGEAP